MKSSKALSLLSAALITGLLLLFAGCEKEKIKNNTTAQYLNVQGRVNKIVGPCHGGCIVIDVDNIDGIGKSQDCFICCDDTVYYNNSISIPSFYKWNDGNLIYTMAGTKYLKELNIGSPISIKCRPATSDDDSLFMTNIMCTANHGCIDCPKYIVESINYIHKQKISITEVLLPNCVYDIIEKEKLVVINSQKEYDSLFTGCSGEKPNIDFQKQTLLISWGISTQCILKKTIKLEKKENNYVLNIQICQGDCTSIETWNAFIVTEKINSNVTLSINNVL